ETLPKDHPLVLTGCYNLGRLLCEEAEFDAGWRLLREAAAARAAHVARVATASPQREHAALAAQQRAVLDGLFDVAERAPALSDGQRRALLEAVLASKGISTRVQGRRHEAALLAGVPGSEEALRRLREARRELATLLLSNPSEMGPRALGDRCKKLE